MKLAIFDIDGTLTKTRVWGGIFDYFLENKQRLGFLVKFYLVHIPRILLMKLSLLNQDDFRGKWSIDIATIFHGIPENEVEKIWAWILENRIKGLIRADILNILRNHSNNGVKVILLSGGPTQLIQHIVNFVGADVGIGTDYEVIDGMYSGLTSKAPCVGENKVIYLQQYIKSSGLDVDLESSFAYGDSTADLAMLNLVGNPVAVYPDKKLNIHAEDNSWKVIK
jgi:HAD superfamily hydrolase (TIGR01490 family)